MTRACEVAIAGGGIVGATLALLLHRDARLEAEQIVLFERGEPQMPAPGAPIDLRVFAFSPASIALLEEVGAWGRVDAARIAPYERMQIWPAQVPADSPDALLFDAAETGEPMLGAIAESRAVQVALLDACVASGIRVVRQEIGGIDFKGATPRLIAGDEWTARLVVAADGANSAVRSAAGIGVREQAYRQTAIVATVRAARPRPATAFQCFLPTGPLALLPLPGGDFSIVWSAEESRAQELLAMDEVLFNAALTEASDDVAGKLSLISARASFPLVRLMAERYVARNCVLVGDAAHVIHPLAGQGVNQGLLDVASLATHLAARPAGEGVAALRALRRYERERRSGNALMGAMVDSLHRLFAGGEVRARIAGEGMAVVGRSAMARRFFMQAAAGRSSPRR